MHGLLRKVVPNFIRRSYAMKFAIVLLILGLSVGAIGLVGTAQLQDGVQSNVYTDHETLALQQAESVNDFHENNQYTVEEFARSSAVDVQDADDQADAQAYVEETMDDRGEGDVGEAQLHLLETDGDVIASTKVDSQGDEGLEGEWVDQIDNESNTYVTNAYESGDVDENEERIAYITASHNIPAGQVLVYTVPLDEYPVTTGDDRYAMVVDGNDRIAFSDPGDDAHSATTNPMFELYTDGGDEEPLIDARDPETGSLGAMEAGPGSSFMDEDFFGSQEYVVGYATIGSSDWVALIHTPTDIAYGFVDDVQQYGLIATIGAVMLIGLVGAVFGWNTSRSIDRLTRKASKMEEGDLEVDLESNRIDSIGRLYSGFGSMRDSLKTQIEETTQARDEAETARAEAERLNDHLEMKADEYSEVMQATADGDLTARMNAESENEAMTDIATEFNEMIAELETTTATIKTFATEVATASEEVTASSEEVQSASTQVAESTQEISEGADRQNDSLQSINQEMSGLSTTIEQIAASSNQVADLAARTAETGERGREAAQDAIEGMQEIETESDAAVAEIEKLETEMEQIDDLLEFITEIAEQTNMLALNANIEASRSESSNEGFSAVAGEVKELSAETREAARDIENRLEEIKSQTERAAAEVQQTSDHVSEHTDSVERAANALDEIADYAVETNTGMQEISSASDEQAASTQEVVAMVDEVATIAEQTSTESETVAAAAEEQTTALTEVSRSAGDLAQRATQLSATLDHFDTDADASDSLEATDIASEEAAVSFDDDEVVSFGEDDVTEGDESDSDTAATTDPLATTPEGGADDETPADDENEDGDGWEDHVGESGDETNTDAANDDGTDPLADSFQFDDEE